MFWVRFSTVLGYVCFIVFAKYIPMITYYCSWDDIVHSRSSVVAGFNVNKHWNITTCQYEIRMNYCYSCAMNHFTKYKIYYITIHYKTKCMHGYCSSYCPGRRMHLHKKRQSQISSLLMPLCGFLLFFTGKPEIIYVSKILKRWGRSPSLLKTTVASWVIPQC